MRVVGILWFPHGWHVNLKCCRTVQLCNDSTPTTVRLNRRVATTGTADDHPGASQPWVTRQQQGQFTQVAHLCNCFQTANDTSATPRNMCSHKLWHCVSQTTLSRSIQLMPSYRQPSFKASQDQQISLGPAKHTPWETTMEIHCFSTRIVPMSHLLIEGFVFEDGLGKGFQVRVWYNMTVEEEVFMSGAISPIVTELYVFRDQSHCKCVHIWCFEDNRVPMFQQNNDLQTFPTW